MSKKRLLIRLLIFFGVIAAIGGLVTWKIFADADRDLRTEIDKAKEDGIWVEKLDDLEPSGPESENGAAQYRVAIGDYSSGSEPISAHLAHNTKSLAEAKKAAQFPFFRSPGVMAIGFRKVSMFEMVGGFQSDFLARAKLEADAGKLTAALDDLDTAAKISHQLNQHPTADGPHKLGFNTGSDARVCEALNELLQRYPSAAKEASQVVDSLGEAQTLVPRARFRLYESFHHLDQPLQDTTQACKNARERECNDIWLSNWPYYRLRFKFGLVHFYRRAIEEFMRDPRPVRFVPFISSLELPTLKSTIDKEPIMFDPPWLGVEARYYASNLAWRRVMRQGIAIMQLGKVPDQLPLQGDAAIDPSNGQPLHFVHQKWGFKVYAVGETGSDFGGRSGGLASDVVFQIPAPPNPRPYMASPAE